MGLIKMINRISKRYLASERLHRQIWGAILKQWWLLALIIIPLALALQPFVSLIYTLFAPVFNPLLRWIDSSFIPYSVILFSEVVGKFFDIQVIKDILLNEKCQLFLLTLIVWLAVLVCRTLTKIFSLRKKDSAITWCQISILIAFGCWIVGFLIIFDIRTHPEFAAAFGIAGTLLGWIFQDTIKGVTAFIHLRFNNLLSIDDWIQIPKYGVDGEVKRVTLTMVTIYNWDTTTSSIPTSVLHTDHFINLKKMMDGKTYGRRMYKTFIFDTGWIYTMSEKEVSKLQQYTDVIRYLPKECMKEGMTNAHLFRLYLFHWLMNHPHVSQQPRLIVRWMDQTESGMPLQVYAFIVDSKLAAFEWQQSSIIEHILESLEWFGLRLYQSPSSYDVSNSNIHLTEQAATYRKESLT